jgi:hypothetical protein
MWTCAVQCGLVAVQVVRGDGAMQVAIPDRGFQFVESYEFGDAECGGVFERRDQSVGVVNYDCGDEEQTDSIWIEANF